MHAERAVPAGTNFLLGRAKSCRWQVFVRRRPPKQGELRTDVSKATMWGGDEAAKDLIGFVRSCCFCALIRGLQNLESPCGKVLILLVGSSCLGGLIRGLQNLESPFGKGFNFVSAESLFWWAESRFAEP